MAASYPSSAKTFTTKATNDVIAASHVNDMQDEITAIESALLTSLQHNLLFTDATYDIGQSGATRPRDFFLSRNATIGGTLGVTGIATLAALLDLSGASAGQVKFPATQNASANANTLDDYEEGTWTPTIIGSTSGAATYTTQTGYYVKVGQLVLAAFDVTAASAGTLVGNVIIGGLPFTILTSFPSITSLWWANLATSTFVNMQGLGVAGATNISVYGATAAAASMAVVNVNVIQNTARLLGALVYRASA